MKIMSISIVHRKYGSDIVFIETDLPEAIHPFSSTLVLQFHAAKYTALEYCKINFPNVPLTEVESS